MQRAVLLSVEHCGADLIREFIALVKKNPGKYFYGDSGAGGNLHLYTEYSKLIASGIRPVGDTPQAFGAWPGKPRSRLNGVRGSRNANIPDWQ